MKTYVITLSQQFPAKHPRKGDPTKFKDNVCTAIFYCKGWDGTHPNQLPSALKYYTVRGNCELWEKRFAKIYRGEACLSVRIWTGKPYNSPQKEIARLTREDGIGLQKIRLVEGNLSGDGVEMYFETEEGKRIDGRRLAARDGLTFSDWLPFFKGHNFMEPLAIIHFTPFRY